MKQKFEHIVEQLFSVKSIISLVLIFTVCYLSIKQDVTLPSEFIVAIVSSVITYFFAKSGDSIK
jgi:hypothetical protein